SRAARAALSVPDQGGGGAAARLPEPARARLGAGGAAEHGTVPRHSPPSRGGEAGRRAARVRGAAVAREPERGLSHRASARAGSHRSRRARPVALTYAGGGAQWPLPPPWVRGGGPWPSPGDAAAATGASTGRTGRRSPLSGRGGACADGPSWDRSGAGADGWSVGAGAAGAIAMTRSPFLSWPLALRLTFVVSAGTTCGGGGAGAATTTGAAAGAGAGVGAGAGAGCSATGWGTIERGVVRMTAMAGAGRRMSGA